MKEDQENWFTHKCGEIENFAQETEDWIDRIMSYPEEENNDENGGDDDIQPSDSISGYQLHIQREKNWLNGKSLITGFQHKFHSLKARGRTQRTASTSCLLKQKTRN